ncbi:MAG: hypothetical protein M3139_02635 [Bacteroidota bacterium]|nr:hypothetical protein [Bacteroidota bacterium]
MEFNDLKTIWDAQNNEPLYAINAQALHNRILQKKKQAYHITNVSELLMIIVNMAAGYFVLQTNFSGNRNNIFMYLLAASMLGVAWYLLFSRIRRLKRDKQFDRSMHGDLNYAISTATYQVRLSLLGRWSILPIALFTLLGLWESGKSVWVIGTVLFFFVLAAFASKWEHGIYKTRKRELEVLKGKLEKTG